MSIPKGYKFSPETRARMSEAQKRRVITPQEREKMAEGVRRHWFGRKHTPETLEKMRVGKDKAYQRPETKARKSEAQKRLWLDPEYRKRHSEAKKRLWSNVEFKERMVREHLSRIHIHRPTRIEIALGAMLREAFPGHEVIAEYHIGRYRADWAIPSLMLAYEADGSYWHSRPGVAEYDQQRDAEMESLGWTVVRFKEAELS